MKHLILFLLLATFSVSAFAQFPLGSKEKEIRAYFDKNIPYASAIDFKTKDGANGVCFRKVRVVGDYTFYFDNDGYCNYYVVTYDNNELDNIVKRLNTAYSPVEDADAKWKSADEDFNVTLLPAKGAENYFSVIYFKSGQDGETSPVAALASN
jgi:hypothetical protein